MLDKSIEDTEALTPGHGRVGLKLPTRRNTCCNGESGLFVAVVADVNSRFTWAYNVEHLQTHRAVVYMVNKQALSVLESLTVAIRTYG